MNGMLHDMHMLHRSPSRRTKLSFLVVIGPTAFSVPAQYNAFSDGRLNRCFMDKKDWSGPSDPSKGTQEFCRKDTRDVRLMGRIRLTYLRRARPSLFVCFSLSFFLCFQYETYGKSF